LNELHKINTDEAPMPGTHNFYRGSHPFVYDEQTREMIEKLENLIDVNGVKSVWNRAMKSKWSNSHVWIHGDFSPGNIIIKDKKLVGVIDFGGMAVGDPACDLTIAWTFLKNESRKIFKDNVGFDEDLCIRARGWAIWKSLFTIFELKDKSVEEFLKQKKIIEDLIEEDKLYNGK
jgi:aminoglycoside phosphotransferase (APT) family kinase protein